MFAVAYLVGYLPHLALHNERLKREQADLARLKSLPSQEALLELEYRRTLATERASFTCPEVNVKSSIF